MCACTTRKRAAARRSLFVHEFAGDWRAWEPQMRYFARRYRCITYSARGYHALRRAAEPDSYGYEKFRDDVIAVLDHLKIDKAHIVRAVDGRLRDAVRRDHVSAARAVADARRHRLGLGARLTEDFRKAAEATAKEYDTVGSAGVAKTYGMGPARIPFEVKDPRGYKEFYDQFASHDAKGAANTLRGYQINRPSIYEFEARDQEDRAADADHLRRRGRPVHRAERLPEEAHRDLGPRDVSQERPHGEHRGARAVQPDALGLPRAGRCRALGPRDKRSIRAEKK